MDPYLILGLSLGGMVIIALLIIGIAWRRCGCPLRFNNQKQRRRKRHRHRQPPRLKVVIRKNCDPPNRNRSEPSSSAHKDSGIELQGASKNHSDGRDGTTDRNTGANVQYQERASPTGFPRMTSREYDNVKAINHFTPVYHPANPETGETIATNSLTDDLGRLTEEEALYQTGLLIGHIPHGEHSHSGPTRQTEAQRLRDIRRAIRHKKAEIIEAKVIERVSELQQLVKASKNNYEILLQNLARINPPIPAVLAAKEQFVSEILRYILTFVADCFPRFRGHVEGFGSYFSGHTGSRCPDYDYQYILHAFDLDDPTQIQVQENETSGSYGITVNSPQVYEEWKDCIVQGNRLDSWKVLQKFKEAIFHTVQHVLVPSEATHGGLLEPGFSGIRGFNKAVCIQYTWRGEPLKIDLVPVLMAPKYVSKNALDDINPELIKVLKQRMVLGKRDLESTITIHTGTGWGLNMGLLSREILQMFDDIPIFRQAKNAIGLIREHLLRVDELNMDRHYASITAKLSEAIKYTHHSEVVQTLRRLADSGQWEPFVLLVKAAVTSHPEVGSAVCDAVFRNPEFHKTLPASLTWYCSDSRRAIMSAKSVLLTDLLVDVYTNKLEELNSPNSTLTAPEVIREVLEMFAEAVRRTNPIASLNNGSNYVNFLKHDASIKPEELFGPFGDLTDAVCGILCSLCKT